MGKCTLALREGSRGEWGWCVTATVGGAAAQGQDGLPRVTAVWLPLRGAGHVDCNNHAPSPSP